jgi:hypothetical protein
LCGVSEAILVPSAESETPDQKSAFAVDMDSGNFACVDGLRYAKQGREEENYDEDAGDQWWSTPCGQWLIRFIDDSSAIFTIC